MRMLIIDRNRSFLEAVRHCVAGLPDCRVTTATSPEAGLRAARAMRPEIVLADDELRTAAGQPVVRALRPLLPEAVLVCLSLDGGSLRERSADVCLDKPRLAETLPPLLATLRH